MVSGFSKLLGSTTAYVAELWFFLLGLIMARRTGYKKLKVQMDSNVIVSMINKH